MSKNVIFTSAGDKTNFYDYWCNDDKNYDIIVCYYGDKQNRPYEKMCNFYFERKGSKFQNFYYLWTTSNKLQQYDNFFILDDDIVITSGEINKLFDILLKYNLWILQPSFSKESKVSHNITRTVNDNFIRYVNFLEVCVMMFNKHSIEKCMNIYDPILVGYGIDYLFLWHLGYDNVDKFAIVDNITCINPYYAGIREICKLQPLCTRKSIFDTIKQKFDIKEWSHKEYSRIKSEL